MYLNINTFLINYLNDDNSKMCKEIFILTQWLIYERVNPFCYKFAY